MSALSIQPPYPIFTESDGLPLENGYVWIGQANQNPLTNPINVYWDTALTIPAVQPIRTLAGYPVYAGTPARLYVDGNYSIQVKDKNGNMVYSAPSATERYSNVVVNIDAVSVAFTGFKGQVGTVENLAQDDGADWIGFQPPGLPAVARSSQDKMRDVLSVKDFGAVGDDITDDSDAFQNAFNTLVANGGGALYIPNGIYRIKRQIVVTCDAQQHITVYGEGRYQSTLDFSDNSSLGILFDSISTSPNQLPVFEVSKIGLITSRDFAGIALDFKYATDLNIDASVYVSDVLIAQNVDRISDSGSGFGYWSTGIQMTNARNSEIRNLHAYGEMQKSPQSNFGVQITGETTAFVFTDSLLLEWTTGLNAVGTSEGVYLNNTDIVYCRYGAQHRFSVGAEPQFTAVGCSFNCANVGVWLENSQQSVIADSLFYAASVLDTAPWPDYTAILINGVNSRFNKVTGCTFSKENQRTGDTTTGIDFNVGSNYTASGCHFFGFSGNPLTFGVQTRTGVDSVIVDNDNIFSDVSSPAIFDAGSTRAYRQPIVQSAAFTAANGATISFPKAFTSVQSLVITHNGTNTLLIATASSLSNTGFTFNTNTGGNVDMWYVATGY